MARRVMQRLQNRPFALRSRVRGEMNRLCGAGRVRTVGDGLKRSVPTAASRQEQQPRATLAGSSSGLYAERVSTVRDGCFHESAGASGVKFGGDALVLLFGRRTKREPCLRGSVGDGGALADRARRGWGSAEWPWRAIGCCWPQARPPAPGSCLRRYRDANGCLDARPSA